MSNMSKVKRSDISIDDGESFDVSYICFIFSNNMNRP